jgi:DNA-directed RNA polymerase specialized sigma24 family protein
MKRVTGEEFVEIVVARMLEGADYNTASWNLLVEDETSRDQMRPNGKQREILECDLSTPHVDYDDDGEEVQHDTQQQQFDWQEPEGDPLYEMLGDLDWYVIRLRTQLVNEAVATVLTKHEQAVVHAIYWAGNTQKEIARGLGCSQQAVSGAHVRALLKLREFYGLPENFPPENLGRNTWDQEREHILGAIRRRGRAADLRLARTRALHCIGVQ